MKWWGWALIALAIWVAAISAVYAHEVFEAEIRRIYDGDTLHVTVEVPVWQGQTQLIPVSVRVRGIDTPELRTRCEREKLLAIRARRHLENLTISGTVKLLNVAKGKYAGRVIADVISDNGSVAELMVAEGLARPYDGGRREPWCPLPQ